MKHGASITGVGSLMAKLDNITSPKGGNKGMNVGIVKSATYPIGKIQGRIQSKTAPQVAEVAFWNEFGTDKIPSRPFMRNAAKDMIESGVVKHIISNHIDPTNPVFDSKLVNALGPILVGIMQKAMKDPEFPANAPFTKMQKTGSETGNTTPLIDTRLLTRSIDFAPADDGVI